jgi:glycosyltransferase involved in cell wall biosynthesis
MISVVIPVRNGMPWLEVQLQALDAQECDEPWEVILADNGSNDGSREFAEEWAADHDCFRLVDASARHGAPAARNIAVQEARGDLLAFCDADDVVLPGWLAACAAGLENADIVAGFFDFWSLNGLPGSRPVPAAIRQLGFLPAGLGANLALRREAFERVSGFNEEPLPGEDIDLCWRLQLQGFRFDVAPGAVVAKRERAEFGLVFRQAYSYGRCGPVLYRRYRLAGARRDMSGALKAWGWLVYSIPKLSRPERRTEWARAAGMRLGRLTGSLEEQVFFP